ncbi:MAG: DEAD/DEAH box helicase [Phycisphaerae bacterium]
MPLQLKLYQQESLAHLDRFLRATVQTGSAHDAFFQLTRKNYFAVDQLPSVPYVCIRIPTGGGKTILAAPAIPLGSNILLRQDRAVVLWLAPTNTIVEQTAAALKNRRHPYREALDAACGGRVSIFTGPEALYIQRATLDADTAVIVSTLAALRVTDTEGRKFYEANGALMPHFTGLAEPQLRMLADESDTSLTTPSLANLLRIHRPIVIMDEAHNARTPLSFDTLQRFAPSCVLELTATPATEHNPRKNLFASNVLHAVSALQLKEEAMIKLPIKVRCQPQWKTAVQEAIARRNELEELAKKEQAATGEYIRPIVLYQAQNEGDEITPAVLKQTLVSDFKILEDQIKISTGKTDELAGQNILSPDSPVRHIITIQKLKEGWDCPFAYVLCTMSNISARTHVEQILGRVLRLPGARPKLHDALNHAYAFVTHPDPHATVLSLTELLEENAGFSHFDASVSVAAESPTLLGPLFGEETTVQLTSAPDLTPATVDIRAKISYDHHTKTLAWTAATPPTDAQLNVLQKCASNERDKIAIAELGKKSRTQALMPAANGQTFSVPQLALREDGQPELFEDQFRDVNWDIAKADPILTEPEFVLPRTVMQTAVVDYDKQSGHIQANFITEIQNQLALFERSFTTPTELANWMAYKIYAPDLNPASKSLFLHRLIKALIDLRGYTFEQLNAARFALVDAATVKITHHRAAALRESFQRYLTPQPPARVDVSAGICFEFPMRSVYPAASLYQGPVKFNKHYYKNIAHMNAEETACAQLIDSHPKVKFWVRNLVGGSFAFWLPTSDDKFYPDFVALLTNGRYLAAEYKGAHLAPGESRDTDEKLAIGQLWDARSNGACIFRLLTKENMHQSLNSL